MTDDELLGRLADEFAREVRQGKLPDIEEYAVKYPELADRIRELFPTLLLLEGMAATEGPAPEDSPDLSGLSPGKMFGHYRIGREIGRGGMGIVYEAVHVLLEKRVALKVLPVRPIMDARHLERFFREARIAAGLHHTNIVPVLDVGQVGGIPYYAMEFIEGRSLNGILYRMQSSFIQNTPAGSSTDSTLDIDTQSQISSGSAPSSNEQVNGTGRFFSDPSIRTCAGLPEKLEEYFRWVAGIGIQTAEGLAHAHERKVIHRDIKPSNLLIDEKGAVWITDFGLARRIEDPAMTQSGTLIGTPRYMSPEQAEATRRPVDQRTDIYSLGATLYELLTCRHVFEGKTPHDVISQIITREPVPPRRLNAEIPADLSTIVMKAMAKRPEDRYQSASQLVEDLNRWLKMEPIQARRIGPVGRTVRWCRRNPRLAAVSAAAGIIILALSGIFYAGLMKEIAKTNQAYRQKNEALLRTEEALKQVDTAREQAEEARVIAENAQKLAESERNTAQLQKEEAERQRMKALYQSYRSNILAADISFQAREIDAAKKQLASCDPSLRGWEWDYLHRSIDMSLAAHSFDNTVSASAPGSVLRNMDVTFEGSGESIFIRAYYSPGLVIGRNPSKKVSVFRYIPGSAGSFTRVDSDTNAVAVSPTGLYTLSSAWNLSNVNVQCAAGDSDASSPVICRPVTYRPTPTSTLKSMEPEFRDRLIVTETMSGRVIATLHQPNVAVWTGDAKALGTLGGGFFFEKNADGELIDPVYSKEGFSGMSSETVFSFYRSFDDRGRFGHFPNVVGGAFSPDGSLLATWSWDNIIYVWDLRTQSLLAKLQGHRDAVRSVSFSPDRMHVASSSIDGTVRVWLIDSGKEIEEFQVPEAGALTYSPEGSRIAAGTYTGSIMVFDVSGNNVPFKLSGHPGPISSLAFSPDATRLASAGSKDREIRLWDVASGSQLTTFIGHAAGVSSVAFNPDGSRIVSGSEDKTVRVWNARNTLAVVRTPGDYFTDIRLNSNGTRALTYNNRTLRSLDTTHINAGQVLEFNSGNHSDASGIGDAAVYQDRVRLALTYEKRGSDGVATERSYGIIDMESGDRILTIGTPDDGTKNIKIRLTPDGTRAAVLSYKQYGLTVVRIWDTNSGKLLATWRLHETRNNSPIEISPDGNLVAMGISTGFIQYVDPSGLNDIHVFAADSKKILVSYPMRRDKVGPIKLFPDGKRMALASGEIVRVLSLQIRKELGILKGHDKEVDTILQIGALAITPDGSRIVTGGTDSTVRIWDANGYGLLLTLRIPSDEEESVTALAVSSNGRSIAAGTESGKVCIWHSDFPSEQ